MDKKATEIYKYVLRYRRHLFTNLEARAILVCCSICINRIIFPSCSNKRFCSFSFNFSSVSLLRVLSTMFHLRFYKVVASIPFSRFLRALLITFSRFRLPETLHCFLGNFFGFEFVCFGLSLLGVHDFCRHRFFQCANVSESLLKFWSEFYINPRGLLLLLNCTLELSLISLNRFLTDRLLKRNFKFWQLFSRLATST